MDLTTFIKKLNTASKADEVVGRQAKYCERASQAIVWL
jgi:hypothetical protein